MKGQINIFGEVAPDRNKEFSSKIKTPCYEPRGKAPHVMELMDTSKTRRLIRKIEKANISKEEKDFLTEAAKRHIKFHYENIADYYAHATPEVQELMEESALVIIDYNRAIEGGFAKLTNTIANIYESDE